MPDLREKDTVKAKDVYKGRERGSVEDKKVFLSISKHYKRTKYRFIPKEDSQTS